MPIRIKHVNANKEFTRGTIVINIPSKETLFKMYVEQTNNLYLKVGASYVHPRDNYNKKIGVARAESYAMAEEAKYCLLKNIEPRSYGWVYHFTTIVPDTRPNTPMFNRLSFGITVSNNSESPRLEYAGFDE